MRRYGETEADQGEKGGNGMNDEYVRDGKTPGLIKSVITSGGSYIVQCVSYLNLTAFVAFAEAPDPKVISSM